MTRDFPGTPAASDLQEATEFIQAYYTGAAFRFGATPLGVDWSCVATQQMRFVQLLRVCDFTSPFSLNDLGCGYGALLEYLALHHPSCDIDYRGIDLSAEMVRLGRLRHPLRAERFVRGARPPSVADYSVASGIFNVRSSQPLSTWETVVAATLCDLAGASRKGFAVNFAVPMSASGGGRISQAGLYATLPERWAQYCTNRLVADVGLVGGYGLAEFTLLVRPRPHEPPTSAWARSSSGR